MSYSVRTRLVLAVFLLAATSAAQMTWQGFVSRNEHYIAYDSDRQKLVMFGGEAGDGSLLNDTWERDTGTWCLAAVSSGKSGMPIPESLAS